MKYLFALATLFVAQSTLAVELEIENCRDVEVTKDRRYVTQTRDWSNGQIRFLVHDLGEPAAQPIGIQINYVRFAGTVNEQRFCVYVTGLSDAYLSRATAEYFPNDNILVIDVPARRYFPDSDRFGGTNARFVIRKEGRLATDIFQAAAR
ncbi:MAG: hypothetical protein AB7H97_21375 [Pseudobdellovibrionaceae bacterium]